MPLYEFRCVDCEKEFESLMKPHDPVECPFCKARSCTKKISTWGGYAINGENGASNSPRRFNNTATESKKEAKAERMSALYKRLEK